MKKKALLCITVLMSFCVCINAAAFFNCKKANAFSATKLHFAAVEELPEDFDELLNDDYGSSEYIAVSGELILSLESVKFDKRYIKYSWFERELSHIEAELFIENSAGAFIDVKTDVKACLIDSSGIVHEAYYAFCENYPQDTPLYHKAKIILFFYPLPVKTDFADLKVNFGESEFWLKNIDIVL